MVRLAETLPLLRYVIDFDNEFQSQFMIRKVNERGTMVHEYASGPSRVSHSGVHYLF